MSRALHLRFELSHSQCHLVAFEPEGRQARTLKRSTWDAELSKEIAALYQSVVMRRPFCAEDDTGVMSVLKELGRRVYDAFLRGIEDVLHDVTELHVHQSALFIPLELAHDGNHFLGLKYSIDNHFSLSTIKWKVPESIRKSDGSRVYDCLIIGGSDDTVLRSFRKDEAHVLWHVDLATDRDDCLDRLHRRGVDILHFAGHGFANAANPAKTELFCREPYEWSLSCEQLQHAWRRPPKLLFLNTCASGSLERQGLVALAEMFVKLGVVRLLVPLWSISDRAAADFAGDFYDRLLVGHRAPEALRDARNRGWHRKSGLLTSLSYVLFTGEAEPEDERSEEGEQS